MNSKLVKSKNLLPLGILSAVMSVGSLMVSGLPVEAQTNSSQINNGTPMDAVPAQGEQPLDRNTPNATPSQSAPLDRNTPNSAPSQSTPLNRYTLENVPLLSYGSEGTTVQDVQTFLNQRGLYEGPIDGVYGPATGDAVKQFQQSNNLETDGIIGMETWEAMLNVANQTSNSQS